MTFTHFKSLKLADYAILVIVALLCYWAVFYDGYPIGDDYKNQIIAFEAFREQVNQGELYPRWLHNINHGFGAANLFFYPPLIYYVEYAIGSVLPVDTQTTTILSLSALFFLIFSGFSCYLWLSSLCSRRGAVIGAALYMAAPYHLFIDMYERNNGAEFAVFAWTPLLFLLAQQSDGSRAKRAALLGLVYAFFLLTHLPSAVFVTPFAGLWALLYAYLRYEGPRPNLLKALLKEAVFFSLSVVLGCFLAGLYLYPALTLLGLVRSYVLWGGTFYDYSLWFLWPKNSCPSPYTNTCTLIFLLGAAGSFLPLIASAFIYDRLESKFRPVFWAISGLAVCCFFMMTPASALIWHIVTPLQKIQFPYRLMILADLFYAALIGLLFSVQTDDSKKLSLYGTWSGFLFVMFALSLHTANYVQQSWHPNKDFFDFRIQNRILTGEFFPNNPEMTIKVSDFAEQTPNVPLVRTEPPDRAELVEQRPRLYVFSVQADKPSVLYLRQFYFPGWRARIDMEGKDLPLEIRAAEPYGQVSIELPQGNYRLFVNLTMMKQEMIGAVMSLCGAIVFCLLLLVGTIWCKRHE